MLCFVDKLKGDTFLPSWTEVEQALLSSIDEYNERENEKERKKERKERMFENKNGIRIKVKQAL